MDQQHYYMIDFSASACLFEIRVNDIPVISMNIKTQVSTKVPINFAMLTSGVQKVTSKMIPMIGESLLTSESELKYSVQLFDTSFNDFQFLKDFASYRSASIDNDKPLPILIGNGSFSADISYKVEEAWKDGMDLTKIDGVRDRLFTAYQNFGNIIASKNYDKFRSQMKIREQRMCTAMLLNSSQSKARLEKLIHDFSNGFNKMQLDPNAIVSFSAYGKMASLRKLNGEPALSFINLELREELMLDLAFFLPKGGQSFEIV